MLHKKEVYKTTEEELNEMEISNMPDKELELINIKMFTRLEKRVEELSETFNKEKNI